MAWLERPSAMSDRISGLPDDRAPGGLAAPVTFRAIALASPWHALVRQPPFAL